MESNSAKAQVNREGEALARVYAITQYVIGAICIVLGIAILIMAPREADRARKAVANITPRLDAYANDIDAAEVSAQQEQRNLAQLSDALQQDSVKLETLKAGYAGTIAEASKLQDLVGQWAGATATIGQTIAKTGHDIGTFKLFPQIGTRTVHVLFASITIPDISLTVPPEFDKYANELEGAGGVLSSTSATISDLGLKGAHTVNQLKDREKSFDNEVDKYAAIIGTCRTDIGTINNTYLPALILQLKHLSYEVASAPMYAEDKIFSLLRIAIAVGCGVILMGLVFGLNALTVMSFDNRLRIAEHTYRIKIVEKIDIASV